MNKNSNFVLILKKQLKKEFSVHDRKGVYAYTQKIMAYNSNRIEGSTLTSEQTASLFDTGSLVGDSNEIYRAKDIEEMTGHFKMFNEVIKSLDKPLTIEMIKSFHFQLKAGVFEDYANGYPVGEFKKYKNHVSDIETELPENIPDKIAELIHKYEKSDKTLKDIVVFHAEYKHIHPFQDGNGRTGRAIMLKQCLDANIIPIIIRDDKKLLYYRALHQAQTENMYDKLLVFFENEQEKYYQNVKDYILPAMHETDIFVDSSNKEFKKFSGIVDSVKSNEIEPQKMEFDNAKGFGTDF
uniref:Fic family protein n=1 Tax=Roseburia faecis TaxID=301302 RepID=UPI0040251932